MEQLLNSKQVSDITTETENLKGSGEIAMSSNNLIELIMNFKTKTDSKSAGNVEFRIVKCSAGMPGAETNVEKVTEQMREVPAECRKEIRDEFRRLIDKYDGVTVITKEV